MIDPWHEIDEHIVNHRIIQALKALMDAFDYGPREAIGAFDTRYRHLRETRPDDFTVGPEQHGRHVRT
ncbi:hypothetical protein [Thermomonospora catenispora]|uniref:hypothetical protein n=1 Tax=Thermomonospora catenispora TaxID=2493090 RepID=UPI001124C3B6|nr:hypothetical protein [Thermomonospora catenispora]TNY36982.1 hypothetical protein EIO00_10500 [Thermomonospora catenispora]